MTNKFKLVKSDNHFQIICDKKGLNVIEENGVVTGIEIEGWASTKDKDRVNDIVEPKAFEEALDMYMKNPIVLLQHKSDKPVGQVTSAEIKTKGLYVKALITEDIDGIFSALKNGVIKTFSIGYRVRDYEEREVKDDNWDIVWYEWVIKKLELFEISLVSVPANPYAMLKSLDGCFEKEIKKEEKEDEIEKEEEKIEEKDTKIEEKEEEIEKPEVSSEEESKSEEGEVEEVLDITEEEKSSDMDTESDDNLEKEDKNEEVEKKDDEKEEITKEEEKEEKVEDKIKQAKELIKDEIAVDEKVETEEEKNKEVAETKEEVIAPEISNESEVSQDSENSDEIAEDEVETNQVEKGTKEEVETAEKSINNEKGIVDTKALEDKISSLEKSLLDSDAKFLALEKKANDVVEFVIKALELTAKLDEKMSKIELNSWIAYNKPAPKKKSALSGLVDTIKSI